MITGSRYFPYSGYILPGVGVAIAMAFVPVGVTPLGVIIEGVAWGVPWGVPWGVWGVPGVCGVIPLGVIWLDGVSSHRLRRLLAEGVGVSWIKSPPPVRSVLGVSAQPLLWPGVSSWRKGRAKIHVYTFQTNKQAINSIISNCYIQYTITGFNSVTCTPWSRRCLVACKS
jgi:hypothetical protein